MSEETSHVGVRMPVGLIKKMNQLAEAHHRDKSGEIIHACTLYVAAHEPPNTPESYYAVLRALEELRAKMLDDLKQKQNSPGWVTVEEGWLK